MMIFRQCRGIYQRDDTIKSLKKRLNTAENLVEDGNKLLKQCVNKMNRGIFLYGQQKIQLGFKTKERTKRGMRTSQQKTPRPSKTKIK